MANDATGAGWPNCHTERAMEVLSWAADEEVNIKAEEALDSGAGEWVLDPNIDGIAGLRVKDSRFNTKPNEVVLTVWFDAEDFEVNEEWLLS